MRLNSGRSPVVFWERRFTAAPSVSQRVLLCRWQSCSSLDCPELLLFAGPSSPRWWSSLHPPAKIECVKLFMEKQIKKTGKSSFGNRNLKNINFPRQFERRNQKEHKLRLRKSYLQLQNFPLLFFEEFLLFLFTLDGSFQLLALGFLLCLLDPQCPEKLETQLSEHFEDGTKSFIFSVSLN